jgi:hypothetical protein
MDINYAIFAIVDVQTRIEEMSTEEIVQALEVARVSLLHSNDTVVGGGRNLEEVKEATERLSANER